MAKGKEGISSGAIMAIAGVALAGFGGWLYWSMVMTSNAPPPPEKLSMGAITPAPPPPEGPELTERVRTFFMKGNVEECMERHLGRESRVEGTLAIELHPDGTVSNAEARTEPQNGGVALCIQQRFARGFTFSGPPTRVSYTFNARWDSGRVSLGQNVASGSKQ